MRALERLKDGLTRVEVSWLWFAALAVGVLAFGAMASSLPGPFLFDDIPLIQGNAWVQSLDHLTKLLGGTLWDTNFTPAIDARTRGFWRPVVQLSYALNWAVGDGDPFWFHLTNLSVHAMNAVLVLFALRRWVGDEIAAVVGASIFALHPVQTETVAWISGRTDSLCCLGLLIASTGFARRIRGSRVAVALEVFGALVALGSKESFVLLPVLLAVESWAERGRPLISRALTRRFFVQAFPELALVVAFIVFHQLVIRVEPLALGVTAENRVPLFLEAWGRFTALLVWPCDLTLGRALFSFRDGKIVPEWGYVALGAATLGVVLWSALAWRRSGGFGVAAWCYVALALPVSSIIWLDYDVLVSPRFMYVPMLAVAFLVSLCVRRFGIGRRWSGRAFLAPLLLVFFVRSFTRAWDFSSAQRFWRSEVTENPRYTAAQLFFVVRELRAGRPLAALRLSHQAFELLSQGQDIELAKAGFVVPALTAVLAVTPDLDRETLRRAARFAADVRQHEPATLRLPGLGLNFAIGRNSIVGQALYTARFRLRVIEADVYSRLGEGTRAMRVLAPALSECPDCWQVLTSAVPVAARVERLDVVGRLAQHAGRVAPREVADQLDQFAEQARRLEHAMLESHGSAYSRVAYWSFVGAYGKAYRIARSAYLEAPSPALRSSLVQLAVLAGDEPAARAYLPSGVSAKAFDAQVRELKRAAGQLDKPRPEGEWVPGQ